MQLERLLPVLAVLLWLIPGAALLLLPFNAGLAFSAWFLTKTSPSTYEYVTKWKILVFGAAAFFMHN